MAKKKTAKKTKEQVYDTEINPLMAKVIEICKKNKIALVASFGIDGDGTCCTSLLLDDAHEPPKSFFDARDAILSSSFGGIFALTITSAQ